MTETEMIDAFLAETRHQSLVDAARVRDFLLDLRSLIVCNELSREDQKAGLYE